MRRNRRRIYRLLLIASFGLALLAPLSVRAQVLPPPPAEKNVRPAKIFVREFKFEGATAFSESELRNVTGLYTGREITADELEDARRAVTLYYVNHAYVNSGAILPDQDPSDGVVRMQIVEGRLSDLKVHDNRWLRTGYIETQLHRWTQSPLNLNELKEGLQLLRQSPNITQVNAELLPGGSPGESTLDLRVHDQHPFRLAIEIDNHRPPSVGAEEIVVRAADLNLTGNNDALDLTYGVANSGASDGWGFSGLDDLGGSYTLPLGPRNTTVIVHGSRYSTSIIEEPFRSLDIDSETSGYGGGLRQPLYQTASREFTLMLDFEHRENDTTLLGEPFDFAGSGAVSGHTEVDVLRFSQEWIDRGQEYVLALRSTFNFGINAFDATDNRVIGDPDGTFFSWLGQGQYVRRLFNTQNRAIIRVAGQYAGERLLALEQMAVGGAYTVRGYRENQIVRDKAVVGTLEFRIPLLFNKAGAGILELAPFFDIGEGWDVGVHQTPQTLASTGIGLVLTPCKNFEAQLFWGHRLHDVDLPDNDPQDLGLHFRIRLTAF
jgi:hemolysin activation/secretion protein